MDDVLEVKMALPLMLHGLRAKGRAAALINSKIPMWSVAEFSRSHVLARGRLRSGTCFPVWALSFEVLCGTT